MSLEDLSFEQRDELAMLAKQLADNEIQLRGSQISQCG